MTRSIHRSRLGVTSRHTVLAQIKPELLQPRHMTRLRGPADLTPDLSDTPGSRPDHAGTRTDHVSHRAGSRRWMTVHAGTHRITPGSRPDHVRNTYGITYHTGPDHTGSRRWITVHVRNTPEHTGSRPDHRPDHAGSRFTPGRITSLDDGSRRNTPDHARITSGSRPVWITSGSRADHVRITCGSLDHSGITGSLDHWITGSPIGSPAGSLDHWITLGSLDHWITGSMDHPSDHPLDHWITYWITGSTDHWLTGSLCCITG